MRSPLLGFFIFASTVTATGVVACGSDSNVGGPRSSDAGLDAATSTCAALGGFCTGVGGCLDPDGGTKYIVGDPASYCSGAGTVCCTASCRGTDDFDCCNGAATNRPECIGGALSCLPGFTKQPKGTCAAIVDGGDDASAATCASFGGFCIGVGGCLDPDGGQKYIVANQTTDCVSADAAARPSARGRRTSAHGDAGSIPECVSGQVGCFRASRCARRAAVARTRECSARGRASSASNLRPSQVSAWPHARGAARAVGLRMASAPEGRHALRRRILRAAEGTVRAPGALVGGSWRRARVQAITGPGRCRKTGERAEILGIRAVTGYAASGDTSAVAELHTSGSTQDCPGPGSHGCPSCARPHTPDALQVPEQQSCAVPHMWPSTKQPSQVIVIELQ